MWLLVWEVCFTIGGIRKCETATSWHPTQEICLEIQAKKTKNLERKAKDISGKALCIPD